MTTSHKRAAISNGALGAAGAGAGALVVWGLQALGADLDPGAGAIGGAVAGVTIFTLKHGMSGVMDLVWRGTSQNGPEEPPTPPPATPKRQAPRRRGT